MMNASANYHVYPGSTVNVQPPTATTKNGWIEVDGDDGNQFAIFPGSTPQDAIDFLLSLERGAAELRLMIEAQR